MLKARGTNDNGRNYFDLSNSHAYGMKAGYITPLKCLHTIPDDYFDVQVSDFTQTDAMATAAFLRGRKEIAGYFVPYNSIWHNFNQYQATREDPQSVVLKDKGILYEPRINRWNLLVPAFEFFYHYLYCEYYLKAINISNRFDQGMNPNTADYNNWMAAKRNYLNFYWTDSECYVNTSHDSVRGAEYPLPKISQINDFGFAGYAGTEKIRDIIFDTVGEYKWCNYLRKLDMLGYGNFYPIFALCEKGFNAYLNSLEYPISRETIQSGTILNQLNDIIYHFALVAARSVYGSVINTLSVLNQHPQRYLNVYPLYAYNHIFYTMFRNSYYDLDYDVRNFNVDYLDCSTLNGSIIVPTNIPNRWYNLECHQWKKDLFTGVMPDTQFGAVSSINIEIPGIDVNTTTGHDGGRWKDGVGDLLPTGSSNITRSPNMAGFVANNLINYYHNHTLRVTSQDRISSFNMLALKRAEALQQYRQDLLRAGNHTQDIFKQIYGAEPKSQLNEHSYFVDVCGGDVIIDPVIATASTGESTNGSLGDISARALVNTGGKFKLSVSDFGCFIFLAYIVPESMYNSYMIDPHLMNLTQEDHFIPQLMNLGFEPLVNEVLNGLSQSPNFVRGYTLPYVEFKTSVDQCHGNYVDFFDETLPDSMDYSEFLPNTFEGSKSHWVAPRTDMQLQSAVSLRNFYVDPRVLNNVFLVQSDSTYETDQFTCFTRINVDSTRQLSELGLPRFC